MKMLSVVLLLVCGAIHASDIEKELNQWGKLMDAVAEQSGSQWLADFQKRHKKPSEAGVRELAGHLDFTEEDMEGDCWMESNPAQLAVKVNGKVICGLTQGNCTNVICEVRQEKRDARQ
jgi:hypothetical protein